MSDADIAYLQTQFANEDFQVRKYDMLTGLPDLSQQLTAIFHDFNSVGFIRDYLLGKVLDKTIEKVVKVAGALMQRNKAVGKVHISVEYTSVQGEPVFLTFSTTLADKDVFITAIHQQVDIVVLEHARRGSNIHISLDNASTINVTIV